MRWCLMGAEGSITSLQREPSQKGGLLLKIVVLFCEKVENVNTLEC